MKNFFDRLKLSLPALSSLLKSLFAKETVFDEITISGDELFSMEIQKALQLLKDRSPNAYRIVRENIENIFQCKMDINTFIGKSQDALALDITNQSTAWIAGKIYYESKKTSILRLLHKDGRRPEKSQYNYEKIADDHYQILKEIGAEYEELRHLADWIEIEFKRADDQKDERKIVSHFARQLYEDEINYDEFLLNIPQHCQDLEVNNLLNLIEHEPQRGGFGGINPEEHDEYLKRVKALIEKLSKVS